MAYASRRRRARSLIDTGLHTHLRSSVESQAYSHVKAGTGVNSRVRRSRIITCLKGRHALHSLLVLDQHADRCALAADARRHVGDTTMSNRVRPAAHHDATVHLAPRYWPVEALVADETLPAFARRVHGGLEQRRDRARTRTEQAGYTAHGTGQTAVRRMYRRLVTLSRMLHNGVGHGTPFVLSTPLARPLACPSMALWDAVLRHTVRSWKFAEGGYPGQRHFYFCV